MGIQEEKQRRRSKKEKGSGKEKNKLNGTVAPESMAHDAEKEKAKSSGLMAERSCLEHGKGDKRKGDAKKDKKMMKNTTKEDEMVNQKQICDSTVENVGPECAELDMDDERKPSKSKKSKQKHENDEPVAKGAASDQIVKNKDKNRREAKQDEMTNQKQTCDFTVENAGPEHSERDKDEGHFSKSKKSKRKHDNHEPVAEHSVGDQIVKSKYKKNREHSISLEENSQIEIIKKGKKREGKEKGIKGSDKVDLDRSQNATAGGEVSDVDGKNDKKKKKHKQKIGDEPDVDGKNDKKKRKGKRKIREESDVHGTNDKFSKKVKQMIEESDVDGKNDRKKNKCKQEITEHFYADGKNDKRKKNGKQKIGEEKKEKEKATLSKDKGRRVSFADDVEIFSIDDCDDEEGGKSGESKFVHGQRFTPEEDATMIEAMRNYAEMKQLGEKGLEMFRASSKHPELKGCWADIAKSLPHRPGAAIYKRARILLYRSDERKWTKEEYEKIRRFVETNGRDWKTLAKELGKSDSHVKDTWRRIKLETLKKGTWTQDEYQNLFDLVNLDLRVKAHQEINPSYRQLRDNISWEAISDKLTTRNHKDCCIKWYQMASPLVNKGDWLNTDDYRLLEALQNVDAVCVEDVDWENLLNHRSAEVCRQRWNQMVRNIGGHKEKPFIEQIEVLSKRYCPEMLDYRK